jgi:hypothetical protein
LSLCSTTTVCAAARRLKAQGERIFDSVQLPRVAPRRGG